MAPEELKCLFNGCISSLIYCYIRFITFRLRLMTPWLINIPFKPSHSITLIQCQQPRQDFTKPLAIQFDDKSVSRIVILCTSFNAYSNTIVHPVFTYRAFLVSKTMLFIVFQINFKVQSRIKTTADLCTQFE